MISRDAQLKVLVQQGSGDTQRCSIRRSRAGAWLLLVFEKAAHRLEAGESHALRVI